MLRFVLCSAMLLLGSTPVIANDSIAELKTGGLIFTRTDAISMDSEQLYVSLDDIQVAYRFRNRTDKDIEAIVAFPMPPVRVNPYGDTALPDTESENFLDFSATIEGQPVAVNLEEKAFAAGLDVTEALREKGVPLFPFGQATYDALNELAPATLRNWVSRGIVFLDRYDTGDGMRDHPTPFWEFRSTYWWRMTFPAGRSIMVEHRYTPSVGGTVGVTFFADGRFAGQAFDDYKERYCMDGAFIDAVQRAMKQRGLDYPPFTESRISYILQTGNNWAGPIDSFKLTVNKGSTSNLVSFCGENVRKIAPTVFEMTQKNYFPDRDFDVLFLKPSGN